MYIYINVNYAFEQAIQLKVEMEEVEQPAVEAEPKKENDDEEDDDDDVDEEDLVCLINFTFNLMGAISFHIGQIRDRGSFLALTSNVLLNYAE